MPVACGDGVRSTGRRSGAVECARDLRPRRRVDLRRPLRHVPSPERVRAVQSSGLPDGPAARDPDRGRHEEPPRRRRTTTWARRWRRRGGSTSQSLDFVARFGSNPTTRVPTTIWATSSCAWGISGKRIRVFERRCASPPQAPRPNTTSAAWRSPAATCSKRSDDFKGLLGSTQSGPLPRPPLRGCSRRQRPPCDRRKT